jgi:superoxide dismutase
MSPNGGGLLQELLAAIESSFGSFDEFKAKFKTEQLNLDQDGLGMCRKK